jgi:hypothetical protein
MVISRNEAEEQIINSYIQLAEPLRRLYNKIPKNLNYLPDNEQKYIIHTYKNYCDSLGIADINGDIQIKVREYLLPDLQLSTDNTIIEILTECREMASKYELPIYSKMPKDKITIYLDDLKTLIHPLGKIQYDNYLDKFFLFPININQNNSTYNAFLKNYLNGLFSNLKETYKIYNIIKDNMNKLESYFSNAEDMLILVVGVSECLNFFNPLIKFFYNARKEINVLCSFISSQNFNGKEIDDNIYSLNEIFKDTGNAIKSLLNETENKIKYFLENTNKPEVGEIIDNDNWFKEMKRKITDCLNKVKIYLIDFLNDNDIIINLIPTEINIKGNINDILLTYPPLSITYTHLMFSNPALRFELSGDILKKEFSLSSEIGIKNNKKVDLNIGSTVSYSEKILNINISMYSLYNMTDYSSIQAKITFPFPVNEKLMDIELFKMGFLIRWRL